MPEWPPDHPAPCGGWKVNERDAVTLGDIAQHYNDADAHVLVIKNVTKDLNPDCTPECCDPDTRPAGCPPACPTGESSTVTPPAPRPACIDPVSGDVTADPGCASQASGVPGTPCGPDLATFRTTSTPTFDLGSGATAATLPPVPCGAGETLVGDNCYKPSSPAEYKSFAQCRKLGFKNVYAGKNWHGCRPFGAECDTDGTWKVCDEPFGSPSCPRWECGSKALNNTPASKKYLTSSLAVSVSTWGGDGTVFISNTIASYAGSNSVDRYSGKLTRTATGSASTTNYLEDGTTTSGAAVSYFPGPELLTLLTQCSQDFDGTVDCDPFGTGTMSITRTSDNSLNLHFESDPVTIYLTRCANGAQQWTTSLSGVCADDSDPTILDTKTMQNVYDITWTLGDGVGGGAYTSADVLSDIEAALSTWDLSDDVLYPPRTDTVTNGGPLVTYNERSETDPTFIGWLDPADAPWTDDSPPMYPTRVEGAIVGAPLPVGSEAYNDYYHKTYAVDDPDYGLGFPQFYRQNALAAYFFCPHMTQWTNELHHLALPHGPFIFCQAEGDGIGATLFYPVLKEDGTQPVAKFYSVIACKWAEVIMFEKPNHNYERPCGNDVTELKQPVDCDDPTSTALRWPDAACSCSDDFVATITDASNTPVIEITTESPHGRADGDTLTICGVKGNTNANGTFTITVTAPDKYTIPAAGNGDYESGGTVSMAAASQYYNDTYRKGNFVYKQWNYNFRDFGESFRCVLQAYDRAQTNATRAANDSDGFGGNCENSDGVQCCPPCPDLTAPDPVRFKQLTDLVDCGGESPIDPRATGQIMEDGDETIGGSKWLASLSCNQYCVEHAPCAPCMAHVAPASQLPESDDDSDKGIAMPYFGDGQKLDWFYGTLWIGRVEQWMTDPLWLAPGRGYEALVCDGVSLKEDDGSCQPDCMEDECAPKYEVYPQRNYEEAECSAPEGTPDLPADARSIGCANLVANLNMDPPVVNTQTVAPGIFECLSPYNYFIEFKAADDACSRGGYALCSGRSGSGVAIGLPVQCSAFAPWAWLLNQEGCVRAGGRFADFYKKNGAVALV